MNRRQFIQYLSATSVAIALGSAHAKQGDGTPVPAAGARPDPVSIAEDLTVVDYRFGITYSRMDSTVQGFFEMQSSMNNTVESPTRVLLAIYDQQGNIVWEERAWPQIGFIGADNPDFLRAEFSASDFDPAKDEWTSLGFSLPNEWSREPFEYDPQSLIVEDLTEDRRKDAWIGEGKVRNNTDQPVAGVELCAVFRDHNGRYAGFADEVIQSEIPVGRTARFKIDVGDNTWVPQDPFQFITGDEYEVSIIAKLR